jgi:hypothetical protein
MRMFLARANPVCDLLVRYASVPGDRVADANDTNEKVVAGPYPRSVWDDPLHRQRSPDGKTVGLGRLPHTNTDALGGEGR